MIKKIIKYLTEITGSIISFLYPLSFSETLNSVRNHLYTGYLKRKFLYVGENSIIEYKAMNLRSLYQVHIGSNVLLGRNIQLCVWKETENSDNPVIEIGENSTIRANGHISAITKIKIGKNLLTGTNVLITDNSHGDFSQNSLNTPPAERTIHSKGPIYIGDNVWLGNNVCVMANVTIGDGAVIGANSVVTHDIPPYCMAAGIPAKVIKSVLEQ